MEGVARAVSGISGNEELPNLKHASRKTVDSGENDAHRATGTARKSTANSGAVFMSAWHRHWASARHRHQLDAHQDYVKSTVDGTLIVDGVIHRAAKGFWHGTPSKHSLREPPATIAQSDRCNQRFSFVTALWTQLCHVHERILLSESLPFSRRHISHST